MSTQSTSSEQIKTNDLRVFVEFIAFIVIAAAQILAASRDLFDVNIITSVSNTALISGSLILFTLTTMSQTYHSNWPDTVSEVVNIRFVVGTVFLLIIAAHLTTLLTGDGYQSTSDIIALFGGFITVVGIAVINSYENYIEMKTTIHKVKQETH